MSDGPFNRRISDGSNWPDLERVGLLEHRLRYGAETTRSELLEAASVCSAYLHAFGYANRQKRDLVARDLRLPQRETKEG